MNFIIIYLILQLIIKLFFKTDKSLLMCGIAGFGAVKGLTPKQREKVWKNMRYLAVCNQSRGVHGSGMYINGQLIKGGNDKEEPEDTTLIMDLLAKHKDLKYEGGPIIMHTRQATIGSHVRKNNHPHHIESKSGDDNKSLILVHNGSIKNMYALEKQTGVKFADWDVDSQGLGMMIDSIGLDVLELYEGYAALLWTVKGEPNTLYVYHGKYCQYATDEEKDAYEERPMYFLQTAEGMYFSSLQSSLETISEGDEKVSCLSYNTVFQVIDGRFTDFRYDIDRLYGPNTSATKPTYGNVYNGYNSGRNWKNPEFDWSADYTDSYSNKNLITTGKNNVSSLKEEVISIDDEDLPIQAKKTGRIYYHKGRFFTENGTLLYGKVNLDNKGIVYPSTSNQPESFFYKGIMLRGAICYQDILMEIKKENSVIKMAEGDYSINFAFIMSKYSMYPVTNYDLEASKMNPFIQDGWYHNGARCKAINFSPKFNSRSYMINKDGFLYNITSSEKEDKVFKSSEEPKIISNFDKVFITSEIAWRTFSADEIDAITLFCSDYMKHQNNFTLDSDELEFEVMNVIDNAVKSTISIRQELEDVGGGLEKFLETAKMNRLKKDEITDIEIIEEEPIDDATGEEIQRELVNERVREVITSLGLVNTSLDDVAVYTGDPFGQEIVDEGYRLIENAKHRIAELAEEYKEPEIANLVNNTINIQKI
jgi:hypothetical protein